MNKKCIKCRNVVSENEKIRIGINGDCFHKFRDWKEIGKIILGMLVIIFILLGYRIIGYLDGLEKGHIICLEEQLNK